MTDFIHDNGDRAKSNVTGYIGLIIARADHLNGCNRYLVQPQVNVQKEIPDAYWHDEAELVVTKKAVVKGANPDRGGPVSKTK